MSELRSDIKATPTLVGEDATRFERIVLMGCGNPIGPIPTPGLDAVRKRIVAEGQINKCENGETNMGKHYKKKNVGLYKKYNITRTDGQSAPGCKHADCFLFVLDLDHDEYAVLPLALYAQLCQEHYPELAEDLQDQIKRVYPDNMIDPETGSICENRALTSHERRITKVEGINSVLNFLKSISSPPAFIHPEHMSKLERMTVQCEEYAKMVKAIEMVCSDAARAISILQTLLNHMSAGVAQELRPVLNEAKHICFEQKICGELFQNLNKRKAQPNTGE